LGVGSSKRNNNSNFIEVRRDGIMSNGENGCTLCGNEAIGERSTENISNKNKELDILKCTCINCGIFFSTIGLDNEYKKVFAPYLSNENKWRCPEIMSVPDLNAASNGRDVQCIVSEEKKKSTKFCDEIKNVLLTVGWVRKVDRIHFITNKDAKEWYDKKVQQLSGT
jgi:hypothetical protein